MDVLDALSSAQGRRWRANIVEHITQNHFYRQFSIGEKLLPFFLLSLTLPPICECVSHEWNWFPLKVCLIHMKLVSDTNKWWFWFDGIWTANGLTFSLISLIFMRVSRHSPPPASSPKDGIKSKDGNWLFASGEKFWRPIRHPLRPLRRRYTFRKQFNLIGSSLQTNRNLI